MVQSERGRKETADAQRTMKYLKLNDCVRTAHCAGQAGNAGNTEKCCEEQYTANTTRRLDPYANTRI